jgi:hypothetical protein
VSAPVFSPEADRAAGLKVEITPYRNLDDSVRDIIEKMRAGSASAFLAGHVGEVLKAAGRPAKIFDQVTALVKDFRKRTVYGSDPAMKERTATPEVTLCLANAKVCVPLRDCDDGCIVIGSELLILNIPTRLVKQEFGPGIQPHVVLAFADETGKWNYVDPGGNLAASHPDTGIPVGQAPAAQDETWYDPLDANPSLGLSAMTPELLSFGRSHEVEIVKSFGAVSADMTWQPVDTNTIVEPGDVIRGSVDPTIFNIVSSAFGPLSAFGLPPYKMFQNAIQNGIPICKPPPDGDGCVTWDIGPKPALPADWPSDDPGLKKNFHFRTNPHTGANVKGGDIVDWTPTTSTSNLIEMMGLPVTWAALVATALSRAGIDAVMPTPQLWILKAPTNAPGAPGTNPPANGGSDDIGAGPVIGIAVGVIAVAGVGFYLYRQRRGRR